MSAEVGAASWGELLSRKAAIKQAATLGRHFRWAALSRSAAAGSDRAATAAGEERRGRSRRLRQGCLLAGSAAYEEAGA